MSHHINFDLAAQETNRLSPKDSKNETTSAKKRETKKLEIDNKQMEWRLRQLKLAMEREKEERGKKNFIWESGKDGALESHARNILGKTVKVKSGKNKAPKKVKVSVLTDEPLNIPKRKSHSKDLIEKLMKPTPPKSKLPSTTSPQEPLNKECWISIGKDRFSDDIMDVQSDHTGNLPLSTLHGLNPSAIGLYYMRYGRKRLLLAIDNIVIQPKSGWGNDTYFPYVADISPQKPKLQPTPPSAVQVPSSNRQVSSEPKNDEAGLLLNGSFNEEENAKSFQEAVLAWRSGKTNENTIQSKDSNQALPTSSVKMAVHDVQSDPIQNSEVKFSETSSLSFMEKLLLKKHRATDIPPLTNSVPLYDRVLIGTEEDMFLTSEELEEKERYRNLFTPQPNNNKNSLSSGNFSQVCSISEVDDSVFNPDDQLESSAHCYVEEVSDSDESENRAVSKNSQNTTTNSFNSHHTRIEEVNFTEPSDWTKASPNYRSITNEETILNTAVNKSEKIVTNSFYQIKQESNDKTLVLNNSENANLVEPNEKDGKEAGDMPVVSSGVLNAIGKIPLNPDAVYQHNLNDYFSEMKSEQSKVFSYLDMEPHQIMLCSENNTEWIAPELDGSTSNAIPVLPFDNLPTDTSAIRSYGDNNQEREQDDYNTLEKLEWELASQNGNLTSDGRISRIIDDWSSDDNDVDLGIVNDPGFGSGLSTPDPDPMTLVGTSISFQEDNIMLQEFQKMEDLMLDKDSSDSDLQNSVSYDAS